ncbi:hypothetical protein BC830DRAFT_667190 [Chytriomyces sp. MP71]|nr:hypothetical protein BC830DRAFT_667190 [Chytriomyces sp. MP71]
MLVLVLNVEAAQIKQQSMYTKASMFEKIVVKHQFFECCFDVRTIRMWQRKITVLLKQALDEKVHVFGASAKVIDVDKEEIFFTDGNSSGDLVCVLDFDKVHTAAELALMEALGQEYEIENNLPIKNCGKLAIEDCDLEISHVTEKFEADEIKSLTEKFEADEVKSLIDLGSAKISFDHSKLLLNSPEAHSPPQSKEPLLAVSPPTPLESCNEVSTLTATLQMMQQQQAQMYLMLMQKQFEMLGSLNLPLSSIPQSSAKQGTTCTVGTNTSFVSNPHSTVPVVAKHLVVNSDTQTSLYQPESTSSLEPARDVVGDINEPAFDVGFFHHTDNALPFDTGSNYKPLYTFDTIPTQQPSIFEPTNKRQERHSIVELLSRQPGQVPSAVMKQISKPSASSNLKFPASNLICRPPIQPALLNLQKPVPHLTATNTSCLMDSEMSFLNLSGIDTHHISSNTLDLEEDLENERTREMIAQVVLDPEQSFIFHEKGGKGGREGNPLNLVGAKDNAETSLMSSRDQFSVFTLEYLARHGLLN